MRLLLQLPATFVLVVLLLAPAYGQVPPAQQVIASATVNFGNNTISISGSNFAPNPVVRLGTLDLSVVSSTSSQIVAAFPTGSPASSLSPGTYLLSVRSKQVGAAATNFGISMSVNIGFSVVKEFLPDVARAIAKKRKKPTTTSPPPPSTAESRQSSLACLPCCSGSLQKYRCKTSDVPIDPP